MPFNHGIEYEMHGMVYSYNEKAFEKGLPQLIYRHWPIESDRLRKESLEYAHMLANLNTDAIADRDSRLLVRCISEMAVHFLTDKHEQYREYYDWYLNMVHSDFVDNLGKDYKKSTNAAYELAIHDNGPMQWNLAECLKEGRGIEKNLVRALFWYDTSMCGKREAEPLRMQLEADGKPCRVDGIIYGAKQKYQDIGWWKQYYKEKGLLK